MYFLFPSGLVEPYPSYLYRSSQTSDAPPLSISIDMPQIFSSSSTQITINEPPFAITPNKNSSSKALLPYVLTIDCSSKKFWPQESIRSYIKQNYLAFLKDIEKADALPGMIFLIQQNIALKMPLTFPETLYYQYGFNAIDSYVDLKPGMRLRVDFQNYQLVNPENSDPYVNGFVGAGTSYYQVSEYFDSKMNLFVGIDAFLSNLQKPAVSSSLNQGGAGGIIDFKSNGYAKLYYRLCYPQNFPDTNSAGLSGIQKNITFIGADTIENLEEATITYLQKGIVDPLKASCLYFRGRATITVEISVFINKFLSYVPVGTTLRNVLNQFTYLPRNFNYAISTNVGGITLKRCVGSCFSVLMTSEYPILAFPSYEQICFTTPNSSPRPFSYWNGSDQFDLPLLSGDSISFDLTSNKG